MTHDKSRHSYNAFVIAFYCSFSAVVYPGVDNGGEQQHALIGHYRGGVWVGERGDELGWGRGQVVEGGRRVGGTAVLL